MVFFVWKEEYELGVPHIDLQHTMIVNMMNELFVDLGSRKAPETIKKTLDKLLIYVEEHFEAEETAMRETEYSDMLAHISEHEKFREDVLRLTERYQADEKIAAAELIEFLKTWLRNHIAEVDKKFGNYICKQSEEAKKAFFQ